MNGQVYLRFPPTDDHGRFQKSGTVNRDIFQDVHLRQTFSVKRAGFCMLQRKRRLSYDVKALPGFYDQENHSEHSEQPDYANGLKDSGGHVPVDRQGKIIDPVRRFLRRQG